MNGALFKYVPRVLALLVICSFFLPFVSVSCRVGTQSDKVVFTGADLLFGKELTESERLKGNFSAAVLVAPPLFGLAILPFKRARKLVLYYYGLFPIAGILTALALKSHMSRRIGKMAADAEGSAVGIIAAAADFEVLPEIGMLLYIGLNAVIAALSCAAFIRYLRTDEY